MGPTSLALTGLIALLVLIPTRRLQLAGLGRQALTAYYLAVLLLGIVVAVLPGPTRFLVPFLLVAYLAPFVTLREGLDRLRGRPPGEGGRVEPPGDRRGRSRPMKDVTPPGDRR